MHETSASDMTSAIHLLLEVQSHTLYKGELLYLTDRVSNTPLHSAAKSGCQSACALLLAAMAECEARTGPKDPGIYHTDALLDDLGRSPFYYAVVSGDMDLINLFLSDPGAVLQSLESTESIESTLCHLAQPENVEFARCLFQFVTECGFISMWQDADYYFLLNFYISLTTTLGDEDSIHRAVCEASNGASVWPFLGLAVDKLFAWATCLADTRFALLHAALTPHSVAMNELIGTNGLNFAGQAVYTRHMPALEALRTVGQDHLSGSVSLRNVIPSATDSIAEFYEGVSKT